MRTDLDRLLLLLSLAPLLASCSRNGDAPTAVSPAEGPARGGDVVTISGSFGDQPTVTFGDKEATLQSSDGGSIKVKAPPGIAGTVDVSVTVGAQKAVLEKAYTYRALPLTLIDVAWSVLPPLPVEGGGASIADADGNKHADVFQAGRAEGVWIYPNKGLGQFEEPIQITVDAVDSTTALITPVDVNAVATGDFDGDGKTDLFIGATSGTPSQVMLGDGAFGFQISDGALPDIFGTGQRAVVADLDGDGHLDVITTGSATTAKGTAGLVILRNDGGGTFTDVTTLKIPDLPFAPTGVAVADVDGDGDPDLFFGADQEPCRLYLNDGKGAFKRAAPDALPYDPTPGAGIPALGDFDGDGSPDIYLPTTTQDRVLFNDGTGHFTDLTDVRLGPDATAGASATLADLDLDGHLDVAAIDGNGRVRLYRNDGTGRFFDYSQEIAGNDGHLPAIDIAVADLDEDGAPDLFVSRQDLSRAALLVDWSPLSAPDPDKDGVPTGVDNCPTVPNADQASLYGLPFRCDSRTTCAAATGCELHAFSGWAYLFCKTAAPWDAAQAACASFGANLVTVTSADENSFLTSLGAADLWIGYTDAAMEGTFVWADGGDSTFTNWGMSQPDNSGGDENCVELLADGTWNDIVCSGAHAYVCKDLRQKTPGPGTACDCTMGGELPDGGAAVCAPDGGVDGGADAGP